MEKKGARRSSVLQMLEGGMAPGVADRVSQETGVPAADIYGTGTFYTLLDQKRVKRDGDTVRVTSRRGTVEAKVNVSPRMRPGCVWMPLHFADSNVNLVTNDAGDSITGTGEYKVGAVRVESAGVA